MREIAKKRGGQCLSPRYINRRTKLKWRCEDGHEWEADSHGIKKGSWCPVCAGVQKGSIEEMQEIAAQRGGQCLSEQYVDCRAKLTWQCKNGHQWDAAPSHIKQGCWCPACAGLKKGTIEEMQEIARERGGACLSNKYINGSVKLKWQCRKGHKWETVPANIKKGYWCPDCALAKKSMLAEMRKIARERGGKCLSRKYISSDAKLTWQCKEGHEWEAVPNNIKQGTWCPVCTINAQRDTIEEMQKIAEERGGKCLSREYIDSRTKLTWQCKEGHQWETVPGHIKEGTWCAACAGKQKGTIEEMRSIAGSQGGQCLSPKYINSSTKLKWQCKQGHQWEATPENIKRGSWCLACAGLKKSTIEEMREIAEERGGKCLSEEYVNGRTKLTWQCKDNHQWEATPASIKQGHWCPLCADRRHKNL